MISCSLKELSLFDNSSIASGSFIFTYDREAINSFRSCQALPRRPVDKGEQRCQVYARLDAT
jgi:hypothetical protein